MTEAPQDRRRSVAHDLNNLLCRIMGSAELAMDRAADPQVEHELQAIMTNTALAAELVAGFDANPPPEAPRVSG
jgi:hypothetical protein